MQLRQAQVREIDGARYEVTPLGAIRGSQVFVRLLKVLGPVFSSKDVSKLFEGLTEDDMNYLVGAFSPTTMVMGSGQLDKIFDIHFAGRMMSMLKWLFFCMEVNYADFFAKGNISLSGVMSGTTQGPSQSTSPTDVTGPSGVS
jgi:hypothetical protein